MSKLETLISTLNCTDEVKLYKDMNIETDAIVINQVKSNSVEKVDINERVCRILRFNEKGVGLSRNMSLMRSDADICIMADDDMKYKKNYSQKIEEAYRKYPDADMIVFNVVIHDNDRTRETVKTNKRVHFYNSLRYGTVTFTFKRESIIKKNIFFSVLFGGGAKYGCGEDSLFIWSVLSKGLKVYAVNETIAEIYNGESTWFNGYNDKYFYDKGALFKALSSKYYYFLILQFVFRQKNIIPRKNRKKIFKIMLSGAKNY